MPHTLHYPTVKAKASAGAAGNEIPLGHINAMSPQPRHPLHQRQKRISSGGRDPPNRLRTVTTTGIKHRTRDSLAGAGKWGDRERDRNNPAPEREGEKVKRSA